MTSPLTSNVLFLRHHPPSFSPPTVVIVITLFHPTKQYTFIIIIVIIITITRKRWHKPFQSGLALRTTIAFFYLFIRELSI
jgi:hypothetical protein